MRKMAVTITMAIFFAFVFSGCMLKEPDRETVNIAVASDKASANTENYLKKWLEEKSGLKIELIVIDPDYMPEYLRLLFSVDKGDVDAVFLQPNTLTKQQVEAYALDGKIIAIDDYIKNTGRYFSTAMEGFPNYELSSSMAASDGKIYYMPNINYSAATRNAQTLWMNIEWLASLSVPIPQTTEDFAQVMREFKSKDPNKNGILDEMPIVGSASKDNQFLPYFLMNAFVYTDFENAFLYLKNSELCFAPTSDEWREGLRYCKKLYDEGLLTNDCFDYSSRQLIAAANDSRNLVGALTAESITDVIFDSSPELLNAFTHIPPLQGPSGERNAVIKTPRAYPGGIITSSCKNPESVFKLMDFMLSEEAFLIAAYGEENVDWRRAELGDLSLGGEPASVVVLNRSQNNLYNKTLLQAGPFVSYPSYTDSVAWNGFQTDYWYMNARAARAYSQYETDEPLQLLQSNDDLENKMSALKDYVKLHMKEFVTGETDIENNAEWESYKSGFAKLDLNTIIYTVRKGIDENGGVK